MIPRVVHRIWCGDNPVPEQYEAWWQGWQRQLPDYQFVTWTDREFASLKAVTAQIAVADSNAKKADIARYEIMRQHGGIYLDCDFMPVNHYDFAAEDADLVICHEKANETRLCSNGFFAAAPNHPLMNLAVSLVTGMNLNSTEIIGETGPGFFARLLTYGTYKRLPTPSFYPYLFNEPFSFVYSRNLERTFGIHVWFNSWFPVDLQIKKIYSMMLHGDLRETERLLGNLSDKSDMAGYVLDYIDRVRALRNSILDLSQTHMLRGLIGWKNTACFALFKMAYYLFTQASAAKEGGLVVWQIGAGDGLFDDALRAILINFDPVAVLLEPNPHLFRRLTANYANNRNMVLINAAYGPEKGRLRMNMVDPARAAGHGLPAAAAGASSIFADPRCFLGKLLAQDATRSATQSSFDTVDVDMVGFEQLCAASGGRMPDILVVDTEGMEVFTIATILNKGATPRIVYFDAEHLQDEEKTIIEARLADGWDLVDLGKYWAAYRKDFFQAFCRTMFVEHGEPTLFRNLTNMISREVPEVEAPL